MLDPIEIALIIITVIVAVLFLVRGWIRIINTAYSESTLQGRLCLFPLYAIYYAIKRQHSDFKSVISEFMKAGVERNVETAYACWSPQYATKEEVAELIESNRDAFMGYERLSINSLGTRSVESISDVADFTAGTQVTEGDVGGTISYTGGKRLSFKAKLLEENGIWKITSMQIGWTDMMDKVKRLSIRLGGPPEQG